LGNSFDDLLNVQDEYAEQHMRMINECVIPRLDREIQENFRGIERPDFDQMNFRETGKTP
jgi:hypothetical protein